MYSLSLFLFFFFTHIWANLQPFPPFPYLDLSRNLVLRSFYSLHLSRHFEYISILVGNVGHVILLCAKVFSLAATILKTEKTLGTRLRRWSCDCPSRKTPVDQKHRAISRQEKMAFPTPRRVVLGLLSPSPRVCTVIRTSADFTTKISRIDRLPNLLAMVLRLRAARAGSALNLTNFEVFKQHRLRFWVQSFLVVPARNGQKLYCLY